MECDEPGLEVMAEMKSQITMYSIIVGLSILLVFVAPCVLFALLAKCFQSQSPRRRSSTLRSMFAAGMKLWDGKEAVDTLDSTGFGVYGPIQLAPSHLNCISKIAGFKPKLPCTSVWKAFAPPNMVSEEGAFAERLVAIKKLNDSDINNKDGISHSMCLRSELQLLSQLSPHYHLQNLLGVCQHNSNPAALIFEYCPYGCFHPYLLIKRRARVSQNKKLWAGLDYVSEEAQTIKALDEMDRPRLSLLLDSYETRSRPFKIPLCETFSEVHLLLFSLQIASVLEFLCKQGFPHKRLSTESILIGPDFYLKVTGMDFEVPAVHKSKSGPRALRRTASGRNLVKWDAPEVIEKELYSEKSEVWRFGMTLWEICTLGDTPFEEVPYRSLAELVKKGLVPRQPDQTSAVLYSMMTKCWQIDAASRPTFSEILETINSLLRKHEFSSDAHPTPSASFEPHSLPSESDSTTGLMGRLSPISDQDSITGSLYRRSSRRPYTLPQGRVVLSEASPPPSSIAGYLETDV